MACAGGVKQGDECRGQWIIAAGTSSVSAADRSNRLDLHGQQAQASTKDLLNTHLLPSCINSSTYGLDGSKHRQAAHKTHPLSQKQEHKDERIPTAVLK